jgi:ribosome-associated protein
MTASAEARETAQLAAQAAADKLATDVSIVDVSERLAITDAFVLASAPSERQVQAIVDEVEERLREHGVKPVRREGVAEARWVLLDFVDVVVHVQHAEERAYYALERLWKDCPAIPFVDRSARPGDRSVPAAEGSAATLSQDDVDPASADPTPIPPPPEDEQPSAQETTGR